MSGPRYLTPTRGMLGQGNDQVRSMRALHVFEGFFVAVLLGIFSYFVLDARITIFFHHLVMSHVMLHKYVSHIPDFLFQIVLAMTIFCWTALSVWFARGIQNVHTRFMQLCGVSVPLAYMAKTVLQYTFGRADPTMWLLHPHLTGFHWFHGGAGYTSFPSGHMTVFVALAAVLWLQYPRYRKLYVTGVGLLGAALVATNYHFVSDVVAGTYLGILICYICDFGLVVASESYRAPRSVVSVGD